MVECPLPALEPDNQSPKTLVGHLKRNSISRKRKRIRQRKTGRTKEVAGTMLQSETPEGRELSLRETRRMKEEEGEGSE